MLPSSDAALLAALPTPELALECLRRWRLYLDGGRTDLAYEALVYVEYECGVKGCLSAFDSAGEQARRERDEFRWDQWRRLQELRARIPRKETA